MPRDGEDEDDLRLYFLTLAVGSQHAAPTSSTDQHGEDELGHAPCLTDEDTEVE